jgi:hypothetical protein
MGVQWLLSALIVGCAVGALVIPKIRPTRWYINGGTNSNFAEAVALLETGRLNLPGHFLDTAEHEGKYYNVYPPAFTLISLALLAPEKAVLEAGQEYFMLPVLQFVVLVLPLPVLGFWAFARCTKDPARTAIWTVYWLAGSALLPTLVRCDNGSVYFVNHVISQTGLLLILGDLAGRRRIWVALLGLILAGWSRQLMIAYVIPIIWVIARQIEPSRRRRWLIVTAVVAGVLVGGLMLLDTLKFGNPFETGYGYVFDQWRPRYYSDETAHGLFSLRYIPSNVWYLFAALPRPRFEFIPAPKLDWSTQDFGVSLLLTMPVVVFVLIDARRWWRDGYRRWWMLATLPVLAAVLCYQNSGWPQPGFHRFALDFVLVWLAVIAGGPTTGRRTWVVATMLAWSVLYFQITCQIGLPGGGVG